MDLVLNGLLFLVHNLQRLVCFRIHKFNFYLAKLAVALLVGGGVGKHVLAAQGLRDGLENSGELAVEVREERHSATLRSECLHLTVGLEEISRAGDKLEVIAAYDGLELTF